MCRLFFVAFSLSFLLISCSGDDDGDVPADKPDFYVLDIGNNWNYEVLQYNFQTEEYDLLDLDLRVEIAGSSEINGETYFLFETTASGSDACELCMGELGNEMRRDSLGYLINEQGHIRFSKDNPQEYLLSDNTWGTIFGELQLGVFDVSTPAGDFQTLQNELYIKLPNGEIAPGRDTSNYSEDVGLTFRTISSINNPNPIYQMRLTSFVIVEN